MASKKAKEPAMFLKKAIAGSTIRLEIMNFVGRKMQLSVYLETTVRQLKQRLTATYGIRTERLSLVWCQNGDRHTLLDDSMTVQKTGLQDGDRLMLIPAMHSGRPGDTKIFVPVDEYKFNLVIDRMLATAGKQRNPNCDYMLLQKSNQAEGEYTVVEIPRPKPRQSQTKASASDSVSMEEELESPMSDIDREHNTKTRDKVKAIRDKIDSMKKKRLKKRRRRVLCAGNPVGAANVRR